MKSYLSIGNHKQRVTDTKIRAVVQSYNKNGVNWRIYGKWGGRREARSYLTLEEEKSLLLKKNKRSIKKIKENVDAKSLEFQNQDDNRPIKLFFQDEARFGRIDNISSCWVPGTKRAKVGNQIIRKYTYAYTALCPETGEHFSLVLPYANTNCMDIFMDEFSEYFSNYRIVLAMDGASWHTGDKVKKWDNIVPLIQPPYSPKLNPVENIWHHIREKYQFKNTSFNSMEEVENKLSFALSDMGKDTVKSITAFKWIMKVFNTT